MLDTYHWVVGSYDPTPCPSQCGLPESTRVRSVTCQYTGNNSTVDDSLCTEQKPTTTETCPATYDCRNQTLCLLYSFTIITFYF